MGGFCRAIVAGKVRVVEIPCHGCGVLPVDAGRLQRGEVVQESVLYREPVHYYAPRLRLVCVSMVAQIFGIIAPVLVCVLIGFVWVRRGRPFDTGMVSSLVMYIGAP